MELAHTPTIEASLCVELDTHLIYVSQVPHTCSIGFGSSD